ncbi:SKP1-like protein 1A [Forsythia ovata]|uniref:SKP1-like protein 1A n=1 Tax=Forsythia ovata TaxID=205694 RepID=A0ABD1QL88_9LAMI
MIFLMSIVDGMIFEVEESVAFESPMIRLKVERHFDPDADGALSAAGQDVNEILEAMEAEFKELLRMDFDRIILHCRHHVDNAADVALAAGNPAVIDNVAAQALRSFDADFVRVDASTLLDLF